MKRFAEKSLLLSLIFLIQACGSAVDVTGSWKNPDVTPTKDFDQIMVTAMVSNEPAKRAMEDAVEAELEEHGVASTKGHVLFPAMFSDRFEADRDQMIKKIQETENDAILVISLLDEETETRYMPGGRMGPYRPMANNGWYGTFWGYYDYYYPMVYDQGYYTTTRIYYMEANLYDGTSEKLVWSAQTETYDPARMESFASDFAETIVAELQEEALLAGPPEVAQTEE